jgi:hypothetical protein
MSIDEYRIREFFLFFEIAFIGRFSVIGNIFLRIYPIVTKILIMQRDIGFIAGRLKNVALFLNLSIF